MIILLLPAFDEEISIPPLVEKVEKKMQAMGLEYLIVACNDGSSDRTGELFESYAKTKPFKVIHHKINRGLGETCRDLFEYASSTCGPDDIIIRMDCDDTHDPELFSALISKIQEGNDVVTASRFKRGGGQLGVPICRVILSRCANLLMKLAFMIPNLNEYSCGFRAYRASIIQESIKKFGNNFIQLKGLGFTCTVEKLIKLKIIGARFAEVPFTLRYDKKKSSSKMVTSLTAFGYLTMIFLYHWPWGGWRLSYKTESDKSL